MSRTDTASAASTDYAIRYQPISETTGRTPDVIQETGADDRRRTSTSTLEDARPAEHDGHDEQRSLAAPIPRQAGNIPRAIDPEAQTEIETSPSRWRTLTQGVNPLARRNDEQAPESVAAVAPSSTSDGRRPRDNYERSNRWDLRARLEDFAATQAEKLREKMQPTPETDSLPVTVIPAPPRQGAALAQLLEEEGGGRPRGATHEPLGRSMSEGSAFANFAGLGGGVTSPHLDRTASNPSSQRSPGPSQSTDSPPIIPNQPPLWPGVRRRLDHDDDLSRREPSP